MKRILWACALTLLASAPAARSADTLRVCYFSNGNGNTWRHETRAILEAIQPDIIVTENAGIDPQGGRGPYWLDTITAFRKYEIAPLPSHRGTSLGVTFDPAKVRHINTTYDQFDQAQFQESLFVVLNSKSGKEDTVRINILVGYDGNTPAGRLSVMRRKVKSYYLSGKNILCSAFLFASHDEQAYRVMLDSLGQQLYDPMGDGIPWRINSPDFAYMYDKGPAPEGSFRPANCVGGEGKGLNERFHLMFNDVGLNYVPNSYKVLGNDRMNRTALPINDPPNAAVSKEVADALNCLLRALPVYADYVFNTGTTGTDERIAAERQSVYPNPAADHVVVPIAAPATVSIYTMLGERLSDYAADDGAALTIETSRLPSGVYRAVMQSANGAVLTYPIHIVR